MKKISKICLCVKSGAGFTLVEIILVIGIISIIVTGSYAALTHFSRQQKINTAYENLKNDLNEAKSNASSQVVKNCTDTLVGYQISFAASSYTLQEVCQPSVGPETPSNIKTISVPGITLNSTPAIIKFLILTGKVESSGNVTISNADLGQSKTINISSQGVIR